VDIHAVILATAFTLSLMAMVLSYTFNREYLKRNHSHLILSEHTISRNVISFKSLIVVGVLLYLPILVYLSFQSFLPQNFPTGNILTCFFLNCGLAYFAKSKQVKNHAKRHFWRRIKKIFACGK